MKNIKAKAVAFIAMLSGAIWCCASIISPLVNANTRPDYPVLFVGLVLPFLLIPGLFASVYGFKLLGNVTDTNITRSVGSSLFIAVSFLPTEAGQFVKELYQRRDFVSLTTLVLVTIAMLVYVIIANNVRRSAGLQTNGLEGLFSRPILVLYSLQIWVTIFNLFHSFTPLKKPEDLGYMFFLIIPAIVVPILSAGFVYDKLCMAAGLKKRPLKHSGPKHA